ncbi:MAG: hypothetical protein H0U73_06430 [Tatlockia sp.]|nr:hypothetical protein [Tatlockia sp.]
MTKTLINSTSISNFINKSKEEQQIFMAKVKIRELNQKEDRHLLKKIIAMKVLMEARRAIHDQSLFNITAQFREFLSYFSTEFHFEVDQASSDHRLRKEGGESVVLGSEGARKDGIVAGYRFFHTSEIGQLYWNRKFFTLGVDRSNNIVSKKVNHSNDALSTSFTKTWEILHKENLKSIFAEIKEETSYDNSFGYDLFCAAIYFSNALIDLSFESSYFYVPFALACSLVSYALVIPTALTLFALECFLIQPLKWVINSLLPDEHAAFIEDLQLSYSL